MSVTKRNEIWHYAFMVAGQRYRGSTKQRTRTAALKFESLKRAQLARQEPMMQDIPKLAEFAGVFFDWAKQMVAAKRLKKTTERYYLNGWERIKSTSLAGMRLNTIDRHAVELTALDGSPAYVNQAVRTLRRMLGKAEEMRLIVSAPKLPLMQEQGRDSVISPDDEAALFSHSSEAIKLATMMMQDAGLRRDEVARARIEDIDWQTRTYFVPDGKTHASRRRVPLSDRLFDALFVWAKAKTSGWLFPSQSKKSKLGHIHPDSLSHGFTRARKAAGLPEGVVLYSARHTYGTEAFGRTGDMKAVMKSMGHTEVRTSVRYQHPDLEKIRKAINERNSESKHAPKFATMTQ